MTTIFAGNDRLAEEVLDLAGIGIGPSNLSLASILDGVEGIKSRFFESRAEFDWHPGMMLPDVELQSSYLKDLVTPVVPTSPWSFVSYLVAHKRLYAFLNAHYDAVPRREFAQYLSWVAGRLPNLAFGSEVREVKHERDQFVLRFDQGSARARNIVLGTGTTPFVPAWAAPFIGERCFHNSEARYRLPDLDVARVAVIGGGQSGGEVVEALLNAKPGLKELNWFSRRHNFEPINDTAFSNQVFSPEYVYAFLNLNHDQKLEALKTSILTSDGLSLSTINSIYRRLYSLRYLEHRQIDAKLSPGRDVIQLEPAKEGYRLIVRNRFDGGVEVAHADAIILATGYQFRLPRAVEPLQDRIQFDRHGRPVLQDDYSLVWTGPKHNRIMAQNAGRYSHGIADSQLSLMAWRSAHIVNTLLGRQHFDLEPHDSQINWLSSGHDTASQSIAVDY
ncbi:SidA/IucD/PvdA family monooxygenase [Phyllobacterium sp. 21LDTY02-6]|uniref:lysine N(6)-hydroxylase/L-ornithine N(5)-oxygenase family protein n=1 Tax=Phyllobacterium sp. 21LDTY02-6 TaxID=2944903 RepID=UPI0020204DFE|nr:SidA/IucD/PvdA family monooxygenase [Phyllobacterium sp. 21LDTY02-6]MCO4319623.1 SidA/IucD/PvdA family monooxygenase [Phyllobacterium sp. 21LDTY02-6]